MFVSMYLCMLSFSFFCVEPTSFGFFFHVVVAELDFVFLFISFFHSFSDY